MGSKAAEGKGTKGEGEESAVESTETHSKTEEGDFTEGGELAGTQLCGRQAPATKTASAERGEHNDESLKRGGASEAASPSPENLPKNLSKTQALAKKRTYRGPEEPTVYKRRSRGTREGNPKRRQRREGAEPHGREDPANPKPVVPEREGDRAVTTYQMSSQRASQRKSLGVEDGSLAHVTLSQIFGEDEEIMEIDSPSQNLKRLLEEKNKKQM